MVNKVLKIKSRGVLVMHEKVICGPRPSRNGAGKDSGYHKKI